MGMFDTIKFNCPNCNTELNTQSKSGGCTLGVYPASDCPIDVALDANRHAPVICKCGKGWYFNNIPHGLGNMALIVAPYVEEEDVDESMEDKFKS